MPRRKQPPVDNVQGEAPPLELPTVWADWAPSIDGPCTAALRVYLEAMDAIAADPRALEEETLAGLMFQVWQSATVERTGEVTS